MSLEPDDITFVDYAKLSKNPESYGKNMSEDAAVEILGKLLPRKELEEMIKDPMKDIVIQKMLWKAFDAYIDNFKLLKNKKRNNNEGEDS